MRIVLHRTNERLTFEVSDDGPGADLQTVDRSTGVGLRSVRQRVGGRFGSGGTVAVATTLGDGFSVRVTTPAIEAGGVTA